MIDKSKLKEQARQLPPGPQAAIHELLAELESARNAALEEAAKACEEKLVAESTTREADHNYVVTECAAAIRSLATTTSTEPKGDGITDDTEAIQRLNEPKGQDSHVMPPFAAPAGQQDAAMEALRPFAELAELFDPENRIGNMPGKDSDPIMQWPRLHKEYELTVGHLRTARDVLASRGAAQGRITSDNGGASPAPSAKQEPSAPFPISSIYCLDAKGTRIRLQILRCDVAVNGVEICVAAPSASASPAAPEAQQQPCGQRDYCSRFPFCGCGEPSQFPERDQSKPAEQQGLFRKFDVRRVDGSDQPGGKHHGCRYYVLDLNHDQHAPAAMRAYAAACRATHQHLADDIEAEFGAAPVAGSQQIETTDEARAYLIRWMLAHFPTDKTFSRYINDRLAGDFAWQLARALAAAAPAVPVPAEQDLARDAARYRWVRHMVWDSTCFRNEGRMKIGEELDAAVDAAMAAPSLQQGKEGAAS